MYNIYMGNYLMILSSPGLFGGQVAKAGDAKHARDALQAGKWLPTTGQNHWSVAVCSYFFFLMNQKTELSISPNLFILIQSYLILFSFIQSDIVIWWYSMI